MPSVKKLSQVYASVLQRVYGITFPDKESMADYKHRMEEAKKRDHRLQGSKMELFFFDRLSPGSCFFLPNGARIYNLLMEVGSPGSAWWQSGGLTNQGTYFKPAWAGTGHRAQPASRSALAA